jgi:predicted Zn-dependent protease
MKKWFRFALGFRLIFLVFFVYSSPAQPRLPSLGDSASDELSPVAERRLGAGLMANARRERAIFDDAELTEYVTTLGGELAATSARLGETEAVSANDMQFFLVQDRAINAFALPGGFVGVNTGLIWAAHTESELASVLAHEIGHVTQRHIARMLSEQKATSPAMLAAMAVAIFAARAGGASSGDLAQGVIAGTQALSIQQQLNFSRDAEREADRIGFQTLVGAGFEPQGMPDFFQRLQQASRLYDDSFPGYLRTHPLTVERMADVQNRARGAGYKQRVDRIEFVLARWRVKALEPSTIAAQRATLNELRQLPAQRGWVEGAKHYALALLHLALNETSQAQTALQQARKTLPPHPWLDKLAAELALQSGQAASALEPLREAQSRWPQSRPLRLMLAQALQAAGQHAPAVTYLRDQTALYAADARLYELLALSYEALGQRVRQHQALAEMYRLEGWLEAAVDQLESAQRLMRGLGTLPEEFVLASEVNARLRELREQVLEENQRKR